MEFFLGYAAVVVQLVHHGHHCGNGGIVLHGLVVLGYLLYGTVYQRLHLGPYAVKIVYHILHAPDPVQEPAATPCALCTPGYGLIKCAHKHLIEPEGICAHLLHYIVGIDHVAPGLGHLFAVLAQYHAVAGALFVGLLGGHYAYIIEELIPEAGVEQMQRGMLHASVVPVHGHPVFEGFTACKLLVVVGVAVAYEIPAGARPVGHGVGLAVCRAAALGAGGLYPVGCAGQCGGAVVGGLKVLYLRQLQRKLTVGQGYPAALIAVYEGYGLAPVALTGKYPVPQLVVYLFFAYALLLQPLYHGGDSLLYGKTVEEAGVYHYAALNVGVAFLLNVPAAGDHFYYGHIELLGEFPVALVMGGNCHYGAGAVAH